MSTCPTSSSVLEASPLRPGGFPRRPALRLVASPRPSPRRSVSPGVYRRRRLTAVVIGLVLTLGAVVVRTSFSAGRPAARPAEAVGGRSHVVRPGDTLWSIARALEPEGDVRPVVDRLSKARGSKPLRPGERVVVHRGEGPKVEQ